MQNLNLLKIKMSIKLNENQLIAIHLLASGLKASNIAKQLGVREETLSRWRQEPIFKEALEDKIEIILREIIESQKHLLIMSQTIILKTLESKSIDLVKKSNIALKFISLMKGKDDLSEQSSKRLISYKHNRGFNFELY